MKRKRHYYIIAAYKNYDLLASSSYYVETIEELIQAYKEDDCKIETYDLIDSNRIEITKYEY